MFVFHVIFTKFGTEPQSQPGLNSKSYFWQGRNQLYSSGNRLNIDYGQADEIMVSLQNGNDSETLIQNVTGVLLSGELYEDGSSDTFGGRNDIALPLAAYVLMINGDMWIVEFDCAFSTRPHQIFDGVAISGWMSSGGDVVINIIHVRIPQKHTNASSD